MQLVDDAIKRAIGKSKVNFTGCSTNSLSYTTQNHAPSTQHESMESFLSGSFCEKGTVSVVIQVVTYTFRLKNKLCVHIDSKLAEPPVVKIFKAPYTTKKYRSTLVPRHKLACDPNKEHEGILKTWGQKVPMRTKPKQQPSIVS